MAATEGITSVVSQLQQARVDIESDIDVYIRAITDLRSRLNTLTLIGRLPPELLAEIFIRRAMDDYYSGALYYYSKWSWIRLAHVCRHFRAVALSTPRFWSYLRLTQKSEPFEALLARSKSAPLHINATIPERIPSPTRALSMGMLQQHVHRIKSLHIDGPLGTIQSFCNNSVLRFDTLEELELIVPSDHAGFETSPLAVVPIVATSNTPPLLRYIELRGIPFRWSDPIFSSPALTTLTVSGRPQRSFPNLASFPDVGSFDELFSVLEAIAPRLETLSIENAVPKHGLEVSKPVRLPQPSRSIPCPLLRKIRLAGDPSYLAHLLNHLSSPLATSIDLEARTLLGSQALFQTLAAHAAEKPPILALQIQGSDNLTLSGWASTQHGAPSGAPFRVSLGAPCSQNLLIAILQGAGSMFARVQELRLSGIYMPLKWTMILARFPSVTHLIVEEHPFGDFFEALMALRTSPAGRILTLFPVLRVLSLSGFRFSLPAEEGEPFDDLLDWAIFRCNCGKPVDIIRLDECKYATEERIELLEEVVVDVDWDGCEAESTTEEEDSEEDPDYYSDDPYYEYHGHYGW